MRTKEFYERLREQYEADLPFVVYREPEIQGKKPMKALLQASDAVHEISDYTESGFIFAPFDDKEAAILIPDANSEKLVSEAQMEESSVSKERPELVDKLKETELPDEKEKHLRLVEKAVRALGSGEMEKVVLSRKEKLRRAGKHPLELFQELLRNYPTAFVYCWYHPKIGLWLGATPETLLNIEGLSFQTMALAGTQQFKGTSEVKWGEKEKQEQQYVTDSIVDSLESLELSEGFEVSGAYTSRAGNLLHLRTDISGRFSSLNNLKEIIHSLHPTPAICGLPKEKAKQFILREEGYKREFYTGFLGELNMKEKRQRSRSRRNVENLAYSAIKKKTSLYVNLRCMQLEKEWVSFYVGGGITKDSIPEDEWQETRNKAQTMKKAFE